MHKTVREVAPPCSGNTVYRPQIYYPDNFNILCTVYVTHPSSRLPPRPYGVPSVSKVRKVHALFGLLQLCVHFYQLCVHFYKCACTFTNCACTFTNCACTFTNCACTFTNCAYKSAHTLGLMKLMARLTTVTHYTFTVKLVYIHGWEIIGIFVIICQLVQSQNH